MISPSRSEPIVLTSKLGVDYHLSYVGSYPRGGLVRHSDKAYATVVNTFLKSAVAKPHDLLDWYNVDTHSRYAQYLDTEPR